jgi:choline-sulfatase
LDQQHLVSGLDILPTVLDYAGLAAPASLRGQSLRTLLEGQSVPWREFVAAENTAGGAARMIRTARYKYIVFDSGDAREQFFDLERDPGELENRIADSSLAGEVTRHRGLLEQWLKDTEDTFGKTPAKVKSSKVKSSKDAAGKRQSGGAGSAAKIKS